MADDGETSYGRVNRLGEAARAAKNAAVGDWWLDPTLWADAGRAHSEVEWAAVFELWTVGYLAGLLAGLVDDALWVDGLRGIRRARRCAAREGVRYGGE